MTLRDQIWDAVLEELVRTGYFKISDLNFNESQRHTVRRVLKEMESLGWLERESDHAAIWRIGPKAQMHMNISAEKIKQAKPSN